MYELVQLSLMWFLAWHINIFDLKTDIYQEARSDTIGTETGDGGDNWKNNSAQEELRRTLARAGGGQG